MNLEKGQTSLVSQIHWNTRLLWSSQSIVVHSLFHSFLRWCLDGVALLSATIEWILKQKRERCPKVQKLKIIQDIYILINKSKRDRISGFFIH